MPKPNFLVIVADDLGWSDTSPFGSEIKTPNLQRLADEGLIFTDFHTASACSPTRSMLLSGTDNHIAGLGQMAETAARYPEYFKDKPGYEGYLNDRVAALPEILSDNGYRTIMSGKWHLGLTKERFPAARGFQKSFALLPGAGNHYAYEPTDDDGNPAIKFLPPLYAVDSEFYDYKNLKDYYSSDYFASQLITFLDEYKTDKPFFAYLPFTAPHWPLQAPKEVTAKYKGFYDSGPDVLRAKRLEKQKELNLIDENTTISPIITDEPEWDELDPNERAKSARSMEIYAAMVEVMDKNIGRVVDYLEKKGELDNTFIIFMSDNGAEGSILEAIPILSSDAPVKYFDNSLENLGNENSFYWYGPRWAQAATAPSRLTKGFITEGGIRCPAIIRYPKLITEKRISTEFSTVMDILPTFLDLANISPIGNIFRNKEVVLPRGVSWVNHLKFGSNIYSNTSFNGWELFSQRAVRRGHWKALYIPKEDRSAKWELFNLETDKGETEDLAEKRPEILSALIEDWVKYEAESGVIIPPDEVGYAMRLFGRKRKN